MTQSQIIAEKNGIVLHV